jgi:tripartite-type tricarboxylate transporter receptor subunit TctC
LPTVAAAGLPGYEAVGMTGMFVPAKTPAAVINRLNQEMVRFLSAPDVKEKFLTIGAEIAAGTPEQFGLAVRSDMSRMGKVIKDAGIKVN